MDKEAFFEVFVEVEVPRFSTPRIPSIPFQSFVENSVFDVFINEEPIRLIANLPDFESDQGVYRSSTSVELTPSTENGEVEKLNFSKTRLLA